MSVPTPAPLQRARAADAGLGNFVCPLRANRREGSRKTLAGLFTTTLAAGAWLELTWDSNVIDVVVITAALVGLVVAAIGAVELVGRDGEVHLYEDGYVEVHRGQEAVVLYAAARDGEWLRIKARTALYAQAA